MLGRRAADQPANRKNSGMCQRPMNPQSTSIANGLGVADVKRAPGRRSSHVEHEQEIDRAHTQPIDVSLGTPPWSHSASALTMKRTTVSFATDSSTLCGCGSQWR